MANCSHMIHNDVFGQQNKSTSTDTVILGAGVIGLATAYYLALACSSSESQTAIPPRARIIVIEPSSHICPAASSQATGGLSDFGFDSGTAELGKLSDALFQEISEKGDFGFSDAKVYRVTPESFTGTPKPPNCWGPVSPVDVSVSELPGWVRRREDVGAELMSGPPHGVHLYGYLALSFGFMLMSQ